MTACKYTNVTIEILEKKLNKSAHLPDEASPAGLSRRIGPVVGRIVPVRLTGQVIKPNTKFKTTFKF